MFERTACLVVVAGMLLGCGGSEPRDPTTGGGETRAFVMCQQPVEGQLRAPSTAKFPYTTSPGVSSTHIGGGVYNVHGYVDAQNAFGAMIRTNWICKIKENADRTWSIVELEM